MKDKIVSKAYAQSVYRLCRDKNIDAAKELTEFTELINKSSDLETVLFMDVFTLEEKLDVTNKVLEKLSLSSEIRNFMSFLITEKRITLLPLIYKDIIVLDDHERGFLRGTIEGVDEKPSEDFMNKITQYLSEKLGKKPELSYIRNEELVSGHRVRVEDLQLDASLNNQLNKFKNEVLNT